MFGGTTADDGCACYYDGLVIFQSDPVYKRYILYAGK